jgi:CheY-like chemotaxis protein
MAPSCGSKLSGKLSRETPHDSASILIVDDERVELRAIVAELNGLGFETLAARDGVDGLHQAKRG